MRFQKILIAVDRSPLAARATEAGFELARSVSGEAAMIHAIASHGRSGVRHLLLGSVAEDVMRHATCPVLVVRAKS